MVKTFYGVDTEFAASTGSNVNNGAGTSTFDYPPNGTFDLIVTSNPGDRDPNLFELGESYIIQFSGKGGGAVLKDATVIRSDPAPDTGGIVVFEGMNADGETVQVVWTPGFDLENWYWSNFDEGASPGFYTTDQTAAYTHQFVCFAADTLIATPQGHCVAGDLRRGDLVFTLDGGHRDILWAGCKTVIGSGANCPVLFEAGSIGNDRPLRLSQQHRVLVRSPMAELMFGAQEVLVPAKALVNGHGIRFALCATITYVHLLLDSHQILIAAGGAPCESLLPGDMSEALLQEDMPAITAAKASTTYKAARPVLTFREACCVAGTCLPATAPELSMI